MKTCDIQRLIFVAATGALVAMIVDNAFQWVNAHNRIRFLELVQEVLEDDVHGTDARCKGQAETQTPMPAEPAETAGKPCD